MNLETIEQVVALVAEHPVSEITLEENGQRVHVVRGARPAAPPAAHIITESAGAALAPAPDEGDRETAEEEPVLLSAPMVGLFHHLTPPLPFGASVKAGQAVGSIESMKLMNDVLAEESGRIVEILIEDAAPVEYGQPLFRLSPT